MAAPHAGHAIDERSSIAFGIQELLRLQRDMAVELAAATCLEEVWRSLFAATLQIPDVDCGGVYLLDYDRRGLDLVAHKNLPPAFAKRTQHFFFESSQGNVVLEGKPLYQPRSSFPRHIQDDLASIGLSFLMVIPIRHQDRVIACLNLASRREEDIAGEIRVALETIAAQLGAVIGRVISDERLQEAHAQLERRVEERTRELEKIRARFQKLFESSPILTAISSIENGRYLDVNGVFLRTLGYKRTEVIGRSSGELSVFCEPDERTRLKAIMAREGAVRNYEARIRTKHGTVLYGLFSGEIVDLGDERVFLSTMVDVTERKKAEEAQRESDDRYRQLVQLSPDPVVILQDERCAFANPAFTEVFGYDKEDIAAGLSFFDLVREQDKPRLKQRYEDRLAGKRLPRTLELDLMAKDATVVPCETSAVLIRHQGRPADLVIIRNISERRQAEQEQRRLQDQLRQSERLEAVGQLAGGVAHDLNNQLTGIVGLADLLRLDCADADVVASHADGILRTARRAARMTAQLLAFARKGKVQTVPVDIHCTIGEVVALLQNSIDKRITIRERLCADHSVVLGDPSQLQAALLNLALNARDAMPEGGELEFETVVADGVSHDNPDSESRGHVCISVKDTGVGMTTELQRRIFDPFFTTKGDDKGTGMGLAAVYGTVTGHHGSIEVHSEPGRGSTFCMRLPLSAEKPANTEESLPRIETVAGAGHVLIVDDEETVCSTTSAMLAKRGYAVTVAHDGHRAVASYREAKHPIDLVILDMVMPAMSGRETFLALRQLDPGVRVLISSGYSIDGLAQEILDLGARGFIQKPFTMDELFRRIDQVVGR